MSLRSSFLTMSQITEKSFTSHAMRKSFTSHAMSQHHLEAWVSCDLTCSVTLLSVSHCATLKKPPTDFTHPEQFCSFNNPPIYRLPFNHFSPRYVKDPHSHICLYWLSQFIWHNFSLYTTNTLIKWFIVCIIQWHSNFYNDICVGIYRAVTAT